jgi:hypothetical protein
VKPSPYAKYIEGVDVMRCLEETPKHIESLARSWSRDRDERSYAPGKWTARQLLTHLAQIEMMFAVRLRFALAQRDYVVQPFEQDDWMAVEASQPALAALESYLGLRRMNLALCRSLSAEQRAKPFTHPEFGTVNVDWLMGWCAGHERHHAPQLETIAAGGV